MRVESEDSQEAREAREITGDDLLQASHPAATPGLEVLLGKQVHGDEHVHRGHDRAPR